MPFRRGGASGRSGERSERALASVALAEEGGCSLVFEGYQYAVTKEQPPRRYAPSPPSQEGSC